MRQKATSISLSPQLFLYQKTPFYLEELYYESMTESILNVRTHLIDDGYDELRFGVRILIFVANCFLLSRVYLALKDYRNLMQDTIRLIGFDNTE